MRPSLNRKTPDVTTRRTADSDELTVLSDIYQDDVGLVVWRRQLPDSLLQSVTDFLAQKPGFQASLSLTPESTAESVAKALGDVACRDALAENIAELVDMFCCLFDLKQAGLRLTALDRAMCPRFHVDRVPCRLITTFQGVATEYLPHHLVDRTKLGPGNGGLPDDQSGLFKNQQDICQLHAGDVALLKGELWEGNEGGGVVHRSPQLAGGARLLLTLDFLG